MRHKSIRIWNPLLKKSQTIHVHAWFEDCRDGFNHKATCDEFPDCGTVKIHYINRTWEREPFDTVINKMVDKIKDGLQKCVRKNRLRKFALDQVAITI